MGEIFISTNVVVYLLGEVVLALLLLVGLGVSIQLLLRWDFDAFTPAQFRLEQQAYLINTMALFIFGMKFLLLLYFAVSVDALAILVPGAMCGAGVITANGYGQPLLVIKLIILALLILWFYLNHYDMHSKDYHWFREKTMLFILIVGVILVEFWLDINYFSHIDTHQPVSCCSTLFGQLEGANPLPFGLNITTLLLLFYLLFIVTLMSFGWREYRVYLLSNGLFLYVAYYAVVYFFGTYIYQLPTHKCPFCMLQSDYYYVGYFIWFSLFMGSFLGINGAITTLWLGKPLSLRIRYGVMGLLSFFVLICTLYVVGYYGLNGVWL